MAISKMKLVNISGPIAKYEKTATEILRLGCFGPENVRAVMSGFKKLMPFDGENIYRDALEKTLAAAGKAEIKLAFSAEKSDMTAEQALAATDEIYSALSDFEEKTAKYTARIAETKQILSQLDYLSGLNIDIGGIFNLTYIKFRFGRMKSEVYRRMDFLRETRSKEAPSRLVPERAAIEMSGWVTEENNPYLFLETGRDEEHVWGVYFAPRVSLEYVDTLFAALQFERFRISDRATGKPSEVRPGLVAELRTLEINLAGIAAEKQSYAQNVRERLGEVYSALILLDRAEELKKTSAHSQNNFYMSGWVPEEDFFALAAALEDIGELKYIVENTNPLHSATPTKLINARIFRPFETFVRMYGVPGYREIDPTPLVALSYLLFFGIMFADLGQGLVLVLLGFALSRFKKMEFGKVLMSCGVSSMVFGILFDSIFGYEGTINRVIFGKDSIVYGFSPMHNMMSTLFISVGIGVGFIVLAMLINIYNRVRQKDYAEALFGHNGVAGLVFYSSVIGVVADKLLLGGKTPISIIFVLLCFVLPLFLIFFKTPLTSLMTGRKKLLHGGFGEFLIETVFELFEDVLSFITNTVSFVRVGAFALSHAGMMFVVFLLADTTAEAAIGSGNLAVVIIGNIVIMALEGLVVGIQALRLEFYELFSRFYTGDGTEFVPATVEGRKE